nr:hypothetical protein 21 [bacterium]BDD47932.1 hypothetical protein 6 [bacterium]
MEYLVDLNATQAAISSLRSDMAAKDQGVRVKLSGLAGIPRNSDEGNTRTIGNVATATAVR